MPSIALREWSASRLPRLDEIDSAHTKTGGTSRGRRYTTLQFNYAYATIVSAQFQGFCRDLHTECVHHLVAGIRPQSVRAIVHEGFVTNRKLDVGNPTPGNLGQDFNRLGIQFWDEVKRAWPGAARAREHLEELNRWRNAIAHQSFDPVNLPGGGLYTFEPYLIVARMRRWRRSCDVLAPVFDRVLNAHLATIHGTTPW